jgi:hypothetical protein
MQRDFQRSLGIALALAAVPALAPGRAAVRADAGRVGVVSHVLVLSDKCEDVSSPEAWKKTYIKNGMSDQEKALAIWRTVVRYRHQCPPPGEYLCPDRNVHDPLKTIHVYGYGMCCCASSNVDALARYLGMKATCRGIGHMIAEVWYDNGWHMLDGSLQQVFTRPDGKIAGAEEIRQAVTRWLDQHPGLRNKQSEGMKADAQKLDLFRQNEGWRKNGPELLASCKYFDANGSGLGTHSWTSTMWYYDRKDVPEYETFPSMGYELNVQLREGEKLTRNWSNQGKVIDWTDADILAGKAPFALQRQLGDRAPGRVGNGTWQYDVPLAGAFLRGGALRAENVQCTAEDHAAPAIHLKSPARTGFFLVRMPSSYVYLGGSVTCRTVIGQGGSVAVSFSDNHGLDWHEIARLDKSGSQKIDLGLRPYRRYDYQLKFELAGAGTGLDALKIINDVQHSQAPLPTLTEGRNTIAFRAGPPEGTITLEGNPDPGGAAWKQLSIQDFHPVCHNAEVRWARPHGHGDVTFKIPTPGDVTRVRMNLGYRLRDANDTFTVWLSLDDGKTFRQVDRLHGPTPGATKYITSGDVPPGSRAALVKLEGKEINTACLFGLRIDVDYKEPAGGFRPVKITYVWDEDGKPKTDVHVAAQPQEAYAITCGPKTVVKSFTVELAQ